MKKTAEIMMLAAVMFIGTAAFAGPRGGHRHHRDGLDLAAGIVHLVMQVVNPQPQVVVAPAPVVVTPPRHHRPVPRYHRPAPRPQRPAPRHHRR